MKTKSSNGRLICFALSIPLICLRIVDGQTPIPVASPLIVTGPYSGLSVSDGQTLRRGEFEFSVAYQGGSVRDEKLPSKLMKREMPYRVILPAGYSNENSSERFPVIYLLHGLTGHYDNWTEKTRIVRLSASRGFIIVTPEGENGWYTDHATKPDDKYESYIIKELIPEVDKKFRTVAVRDHRAVAGLSMGGFGAIKFGLKYPEMFTLVGSFSGALGAASITEKQIPGAIGRTIDVIFGPAGSEIRKANDPFDIVRRATLDDIQKLPFVYLDCGTEDFLFQNNRDFASLLVEKRLRHEFRQLPGKHDWTYWDAQVEEFLELASKRLGVDQKRLPSRAGS